MATPYVCNGTLVKTLTGREGEIICVDRKNKIAYLRVGMAVRSEKLDHLRVISYKGVK